MPEATPGHDYVSMRLAHQQAAVRAGQGVGVYPMSSSLFIRLCHNDPILSAQLAGQGYTSLGMLALLCYRGIDRIIEVDAQSDMGLGEAIRHDRTLWCLTCSSKPSRRVTR